MPWIPNRTIRKRTYQIRGEKTQTPRSSLADLQPRWIFRIRDFGALLSCLLLHLLRRFHLCLPLRKFAMPSAADSLVMPSASCWWEFTHLRTVACSCRCRLAWRVAHVLCDQGNGSLLLWDCSWRHQTLTPVDAGPNSLGPCRGYSPSHGLCFGRSP